jgi:biopolymer transport protein ExbD
MHAKVQEPSAFMEINTTPLIDVLLVLLVMFIITIPLQTHAVKLDLPAPGPKAEVHPIRNELVVAQSGMALWNGTPVNDRELRARLVATQQMQPTPELHLRPDAYARYERVDEVLALIKREHVQKVGFVGNERYAAF